MKNLLPAEQVFERHYRDSSADFWARFGGMPDVEGKRVLDFGCSTGGMVHRLMKAGASTAVGIDLSARAIAYAKERMAEEWGDRVDIRCEDVIEADIEPVDFIVSQNTMEHVMPLKETLTAVVNLCKPGGEMDFGFSPLWHSPHGHHNYPKTRVPWWHLLKGDDVVLDAFRDRVGKDYATVQEAGFNCATPSDFREAFHAQDVDVLSLRYNVGRSPVRTAISQAFRFPSVVPALEKYVTVGMYWHLRKK